MLLDPAIEADIHALAMRYGAPRRIVAPLDGASFDPVARSDRYGEVCMVVRRRNGRLITAIKTFYPMGCFRLLTGGVTHGETIEAALQREVEEETGLQTVIRRFLAVIVYPPQRFATLPFCSMSAAANSDRATRTSALQRSVRSRWRNCQSLRQPSKRRQTASMLQLAATGATGGAFALLCIVWSTRR